MGIPVREMHDKENNAVCGFSPLLRHFKVWFEECQAQGLHVQIGHIS